MVKEETKFSSLWNVLYLMCIILCMVPGYLLVPYGIFFADEPYQIMNTMDVYRSPMAPLTSWSGGFLGALTDFRWIAFRYLSVTINYLAIIVTGIYLYRRVRSFKIAAIAISAAIFLSGLSRHYHNIFGWDCWTTLFTAILIICVLELVRKPGFRYLLVTCVVAALTISFRIPNSAVVIPVGWFILFLTTTRWWRSEKAVPKSYPWLYVIFTGVFFVLIVCGLYGSPGAYMDSLEDNILSKHSVSHLLVVISYDIVRDGVMILALGMLVKVLEVVRGNRYDMRYPGVQKLIVICVSLFAIGFVCLFMYYIPKMLRVSWYDVDWVALALFFALWRYFQRRDAVGVIGTLTVLLMGCTGFVGSNMGFMKYPGYILIPLTTALLLPLCGAKKMRYYMLIAGMPLLIMYFFEVRETSYFDCGLLKADTCVAHGRARGLYSSAENVGIVETLEKVKEENPESVKIVVGEGWRRFVYEYLLDCTDAYMRHDFSESPVLDSPEYVEWLNKRLACIDNPMVIYVHRERNETTVMKEFLDNNMRPSAEYASFTVYGK